MAKQLPFWFNRLRQERLLQGILLVAILGLLLVNLPPFEIWSYDLSFLARPSMNITNIVVIYANEDTPKLLGNEHGQIPRTSHAQLLDRLTQEGAQLVFYDYVFGTADPDPQTDQTLQHAIQKQGSVFLAAAGARDGGLERLSAPIPLLRDAAKGWGHAVLNGGTVRTISGDFAGQKYAVWGAATNANFSLLGQQNRKLTRWINYYGPDATDVLPWCYFHDALSNNIVPPGFFAHKTVFIGQRIATDKLAAARDVFATPYSSWGLPGMPGVAIHATAFLNLVQDDWLRLLPPGWESLLAAIWGAAVTVLSFLVSRKQLLARLLVVLACAVLVCAVSFYIQWHFHWWWAWLVPAFVQPAVGVAWVARYPKPDPYFAFISYRTAEDGSTARLIADHLFAHGRRVFIDVKRLEAGRFDEQLLNAIDNSTYFIVILSRNSLKRCAEPDDWVLRELAHALAKGKRIIPVLKDDFDFNDRQSVPDLPEIGKLRSCHGLKFSSRDFDGFMLGLIRVTR